MGLRAIIVEAIEIARDALIEPPATFKCDCTVPGVV
jgi:hypothetical protein